MDLYFLLTALPIFDKVFLFVETGGVVLIPLIILAFLMALLITEKFLCVFLKNKPKIRNQKNLFLPHTIKTSNYRGLLLYKLTIFIDLPISSNICKYCCCLIFLIILKNKFYKLLYLHTDVEIEFCPLDYY